jgi:hypothetical protein
LRLMCLATSRKLSQALNILAGAGETVPVAGDRR